MNKLLIIFFAAVIASCASTKTSKVVITPAGTWDYTITGTPQGDFNGAMIISSADKIYSAKMNQQGSETTLNKFTWTEATSKVTGEFDYTGYLVYFEATLAGDELIGSMSVEGNSFPFKATRKK